MDIRIASNRRMIRYAVWRSFLDAASAMDVLDFPQTGTKPPKQQPAPYNPEEQYEIKKPAGNEIQLLGRRLSLKGTPPVGSPLYKEMALDVVENPDTYPDLSKLMIQPGAAQLLTDAEVNEVVKIMMNPNPSQMKMLQQMYPRWVTPKTVQEALIYLRNPVDFEKIYSVASFGNENIPRQDVKALAQLIDPRLMRPARDVASYVVAANNSIVVSKLALDIAGVMKARPVPASFGPYGKEACASRDPVNLLILRNAVISRYLDTMEA